MDSVLFEIGSFSIKWYSVLILLAMIMGSLIFYQQIKNKNLPKDDIENIMFYGILFGIIGARIYYVLFNLDYYLQNPLEIVQIWHGGLAIHGGIIAGLITLIIYCRKKQINILLLLDTIVMGLILAQAIGRWGNFFNGEAYGRVVSYSFLKNLHLPDFIIKGMYIEGLYREPTFLYESFFSFIGFCTMTILNKVKNLKVGQLTGIYLIWYGIERIIIESFRSDSLMLGSMKIAQIISSLFIIFGIYLIIKNIKSNKYYKEERLLLKK